MLAGAGCCAVTSIPLWSAASSPESRRRTALTQQGRNARSQLCLDAGPELTQLRTWGTGLMLQGSAFSWTPGPFPGVLVFGNVIRRQPKCLSIDQKGLRPYAGKKLLHYFQTHASPRSIGTFALSCM